MKMSVILAHPDPTASTMQLRKPWSNNSSNRGHGVFFHDLYGETFDPLLAEKEMPYDAPLPPAIRNHCEEIRQAEGIIIIHPNWWGQPPAILKGWIDRVIRPGIAYEFLEGDSGEGIPNGLLRAKAAIVLNTANTEPEREKNVFGDPLETIWRNCVFGLCGVSEFYRRTFSTVITSTESQRRQWLDQIQAMIEAVFPKEEDHERTA